MDEPAGFTQAHARGAQEAHRLQDPRKWVPYGVGAIEGQAGPAPLPILEASAGGPGSSPEAGGPAERPSQAPDFGPGEEPRPPEGAPTATANHELL